jgi:hypothetical protein
LAARRASLMLKLAELGKAEATAYVAKSKPFTLTSAASLANAGRFNRR